MKNEHLEHIVLHIMATCAALLIATIARFSASGIGFDSFTAFMVFLIVFAVMIAVYLSIRVFLEGLMLPWIGKVLAKNPYFRRKIEERQITNPKPEEKTKTEQLSLEEIRDKQQQNILQAQAEKLNIALSYTRECFALYVSDEHLETLINNVRGYIDKMNFDELKPIKTKELSVIDLRHFGWNIWNLYKPRNQMDIAYFLKTVFPDAFREAEVESIKRHLKDDELKGAIKIEERLDMTIKG